MAKFKIFNLDTISGIDLKFKFIEQMLIFSRAFSNKNFLLKCDREHTIWNLLKKIPDQLVKRHLIF